MDAPRECDRWQFSIRSMILMLITVAVIIANRHWLLFNMHEFFWISCIVIFGIGVSIGRVIWLITKFNRLRFVFLTNTMLVSFAVLFLLSVCVRQRWVAYMFADFDDFIWPRPFPYPDHALNALHDWLDARNPGEGYIKLHGEMYTVWKILNISVWIFTAFLAIQNGLLFDVYGSLKKRLNHFADKRQLNIATNDFTQDNAGSITEWVASPDEAHQWAGALTEFPVTLEQFQRWHDDPDVIPFVGTLKGQLVAYGEIWTDADEQEVELARIIVDPEKRGMGVGRAFVNSLLDRALVFHLPNIFLRVVPSNLAAIRCYEKAGFARVSADKEMEFNQKQPVEYVWLQYESNPREN